MIIKKLNMKNFYRFDGCQTIEFSYDNDKNVTVIRGENGTGKTTILSAFYWTFYGDVEAPLEKDKMLNDNALSKINEGECIFAETEVEFSDDSTEYYICRKQKFKKISSKAHCVGEPIVKVGYLAENGNLVYLSDNEEPEDFFEKIIPKNLRGLFFFDGERINKLAQVDGREEIKEAILNILGLTKLEEMGGHLDRMHKDYVRQLKKYSNDERAQAINEEYQSNDYEIKKLEEEHKELKEKLKNTTNSIEAIDRYLNEHNSGTVKALQKERENLSSDIRRLENSIAGIIKEFKTNVSKEFKNYLILKSWNSINTLLEEKREKGELPSDIKAQFVDDLLDRGSCICGRELPEGSQEYLTVANLRDVAGRVELDDAYTRITAYLKNCHENKDDFYSNIEYLSKNKVEAEDDKHKKDKRIKEISKILKNSDEETIKIKENLRSDLISMKTEYDKRLGKVEGDLKDLNKQKEALEKKLDALEYENETAKKIQLWSRTISDLGKLNKEIRDFFVDTTRINLDRKIKEVFKNISRKEYREPILTEKFELKIISTLKTGEDAEVLSTGEGQITSLAFIGSLVSYSREKINSELISDFAGGDFPIVMDSPFGNLDEVHTSHVAKGIGELASQVVIIVSDKQWSSEVEENIFNRVGKMYKMEDGELENDNTKEYTIIREVAF